MRRPTANRDQAILLTLFDSGIRASEFCALRIEDFEAKRGKLEIRHGGGGGAKGGKGRIVYLGKTARHAVWRYLAGREDGDEEAAPLFAVRRDRPFNPSGLRHLIKSVAARGAVKDAYPHKFRHTCALVAMFSRCSPCWGMVVWIWFAIMPRSRRWMWSRLIAKPVP